MDWRAAKALRGERCFHHMNDLSLLPDVTESRKKQRIITQLLPHIQELCGHLSRLMGLREDTRTQMAPMQLKYPGAMLKVHMKMLVAIQITLQHECNSLLVAARKLSVDVIGSRYAESDEEEPSRKLKKRKKTRVVRPNVPLEAELEQPEPAEPPERADSPVCPLDYRLSLVAPLALALAPPREDVVLDHARRWGRRDTVLYLREKVSELGQNLRFSDCCEPGVCDRLTTASFFSVLLDLDAEGRLNLKDIGGLGNPNQILIEGLSDTFFRDLL